MTKQKIPLSLLRIASPCLMYLEPKTKARDSGEHQAQCSGSFAVQDWGSPVEDGLAVTAGEHLPNENKCP